MSETIPITPSKKKIVFLGTILRSLSGNWNEFRLFAFHTRTFLEVLFLLIYTLEQAILIYWGATAQLTLPKVSYFVLVVLFTFAIHKIVMESRMKILDQKVTNLKKEKEMLLQESDELKQEIHEILEENHHI
jgi:cell division protein FtsL|tara:strand:+ start:45 stop:440 length:396 start_codon:yes stop_codon:yes gene_type:complete